MIKFYNTGIVFLFFLLSNLNADAQVVNGLEKKITISFEDTPTRLALKQLEEKCDLYFTYNPSQFDLSKKNNISFNNKSLRSILQSIISNDATFKQLGKNIIIRVPYKETAPKSKATIKGTVINAETGDKLENVTVFQVDKKRSTLSNDSSYSLHVKNKDGYVALSFNKKNFKDTVVIVKIDQIEQTNIELQPLPIKEIDSVKVENINLVKAVTSDKQLTQSENIPNYSVSQFMQVSLIPFVSTNKRMNSHSINNVSLNIFAGYSGGLNGLEIGGFANIDRNEMKGVQVAGFTNIVGGKIEGIQAAGIANVSLDTLKGIQLSGFVNSSIGATEGIQVAGFVNSTIKNSKGFQGAGTLNMAWGNFEGTQLAGTMNFTRHDVKGFQGAGLFNYARDIKGTQFSVLNRARNVKGFQFGLVNISKSVKGASIGLLSFVKEGYQSIDLTTSDVYSANLSFKTGITRFYNIISFGAVSTSERNINTAGYGLGTQIPFAKNKWSFDFDNTFNFFLKAVETPNGQNVNFLFNSDLFLSRVISEHFTFRTGATFNSYTRYNDVQISFIPSNEVESEEGITEEWFGYKMGMTYQF